MDEVPNAPENSDAHTYSSFKLREELQLVLFTFSCGLLCLLETLEFEVALCAVLMDHKAFVL